MTSTGPPAAFSWRPLLVPAYGPSLLGSIGTGAIAPVLALAARELGASVPVAALFVTISVVVEFLVALPVGQLIDRFGERLMLTIGGFIEVVAAVIGWSAGSLWMLALAAVLLGPATAIFIVARQSYLAAVVPVGHRARAMSGLGGVARIGWFLGPLMGAPLVEWSGPRGAFLILGVGGLLAAVLTWFSMALPKDAEAVESSAIDAAALVRPPRVRTSVMVRDHARVFLTVGVGVMVIGLARAARMVVVPLWSEHIGLSAAQVSLLFSLAYGLEVILFYPAGWVMDRFGRVWVAVPVAVVLGASLLALPLASTVWGVGFASLAMGVGNGMASGIVMTLGADLAPADGRGAFLGIWRWLSLIGTNGASLLVALVAGVASIGVASVVVGLVSILGAGWLAHWVPRFDPRRLAEHEPSRGQERPQERDGGGSEPRQQDRRGSGG